MAIPERTDRPHGHKVNANIGRRLRELRADRGLAQADVARRLAVSAAYLNLIEKGKRAVQLPLLWKALELFGVELEPFMASLGETRLEDSLAQLLDEPLLRSLNISEDDLRTLSAEPKAASTIAALFNLYKNARGQLDQLLGALHRAERDAGEERALRQELARPDATRPPSQASSLDGETAAAGSAFAPEELSHGLRSAPDSSRADSSPSGLDGMRFDYSPFDEVVDFLEANDNYFPLLEEMAQRLRTDCGWGRRILSDQIAEALTKRYGVRVEMQTGGDGSVIRRYEADRGVLTLHASLLEHRLKFQLAHTIGLRILDEAPARVREELTHRFVTRHAETPKLIKIHLANYFAGALLLPYDDIFREVTRTRYDVERLSDVFELPYETIAHRVVTLADPKKRGLPMHFVRSDIAGNISKRYAGSTGIRFPASAGSCPKWAVHMAFLTPSVLTRQYSIFPDGRSFFCFAKVVVQPQEGNVMRGTAYSIGLGTHADVAKHLAYASDMPLGEPRDFERVAIPVGVSCRFCERADCAQRAAPSYKFAFSVDEYTKKDNVFSPLLGRESGGRESGGVREGGQARDP